MAMRIDGGRFTVPDVPPLTASEVAEVVEKTKKEKEARERRQHEAICLEVGTHPGCGGKIMYKSRFGVPYTDNPVYGGPKRPLAESVSCSCDECGALFDAYFPKYREQVTAHRNRKE